MSIARPPQLAPFGFWLLAAGLSGLCFCGCGADSISTTSEAFSAPPTTTPADLPKPVPATSSRATRRAARSARIAPALTRLVAAEPGPATKSQLKPVVAKSANSSADPSQAPAAVDSKGKANPASQPAAATAGSKTGPRYTARGKVDPNGTGRFYMGREIAPVMGAAAAPWLERPEREKEESLTKLVASLKIKPGMVIADIGAGSGVITLMLAEKVGADGRVVAVDIQQQMLNLLTRKLKQRKVENVVLVKGTEKSPKLNPATIDLALMVDVYHEFAFPYEMLENIALSLKPGGRVVFVEYRREDPTVPIKLVHKMSEAQVKLEAELPELKLKWKETIADLPLQHVIVFERLAEKPGTDPTPAKPR